MKLQFSIDLHDNEGDRYENGIYIHLSESTIIRFANLIEFENFRIDLAAMAKDIKEAYAGAL